MERVDIKVESLLYFSYSSFTFRSIAWDLNPVFSLHKSMPPFKRTLNLVTLRKDSWHRILFSVEDHMKKADHVIL